MPNKATPGPWSINNWPQAHSNISIGGPGTLIIAKVPLRDVSINEQAANAALISASQDMYEALEDIHNWLVCAAIATPEDMAQSFESMEELARVALSLATKDIK